MTRRLLSLTAVAAVAAASFAPVAGAADTPAPAAKLKVTGAYLYLDHNEASDQDFVRVVFRTASELPRRYDGAIQAGISIDSLSHSIGVAKNRTTIYTGAAEVKGGSIASLAGNGVARKGAKVGRSYTVRFFTRDGQRVTKKMVLRAERKGDDVGKPLSR